MNSLEEGNNRLIKLDYSDLLSKILTLLQNKPSHNFFSFNTEDKQLLINLDDIACEVASLQVENPLGANASNARSATINFSKSSEDSFIKLVQQVRDRLKEHLDFTIQQITPTINLEDYVKNLVTDLSDFTGNINNNLSFNYPFQQQYSGLQKKRLSLHKSKSTTNSLLRFHKLTITVENTQSFDSQIKSSLQNFINVEFASESEDDRQDLNNILEDLVGDGKSDFYCIKRLMDTEAIGKLQREAKINYLEFLKENIYSSEDSIYVEDLIRRLRLIEEYINNPENVDGHYIVNYAGIEVNYREIFSRSDAFDMLPIIPLIIGSLGETTDEKHGKQQFIFGLKLKFGGKVQSKGGVSVFDYYINLLDANNPEHQEELKKTAKNKFFIEKIFKIALLYFFVFAGPDPTAENYTLQSDIEYDPISAFTEKVLPKFQGSNDEDKQKILRGIKKGLEKYNVKHKVEKLKTILQQLLKKETFQPRNYPVHISIKKGILEKDIKTIYKQQSFFKPILRNNIKQGLKYVCVDSSNVNINSLCNLTASINISDIQYFSTEDVQSFSMEYDIRKVYTIPIIVCPQDDLSHKILTNNHLKQTKLIKFAYNHQRLKEAIFSNPESLQIFIYKFTFSFLVYTSLKILLDASKRRLFIPILRMHLADKQNSSPEEEFMLALFAVISHLINEKHRSNSQGFYIKSINQFKISNGLSSLYSVLPKKFKFNDYLPSPGLKKLAIIVVSSRESDRAKGDDYKISNLLGEIVGIDYQEDDYIRLYKFKTFSDICNSNNIYIEPEVLINEVAHLYDKGYKHFLYIAKSPYSNTLNMTKNEDEDKLFFMSKSLIRSLKGDRNDIKIYPVFFDQYYVTKLKNLGASSLYIKDTSELTNLVEDPSKRSVVFFNLFNGIIVPGEERYYNGVISYATLLNIYKDILDDTDIYTGLIDNSNLKNELLNYLTLFHFSQYEAAPRKDRNISLKLDPYQSIIGDDSVGAVSIFNHMTSNVKFNLLAFLTKVRKALNVTLTLENQIK